MTLDDDGPRAAANEDPTGFVENAALPLCIDEFQKAPALLPAIKARVDRARAGESARLRDLVRNAQQLDELPTLLRLAATRISGLLSPTGIARDAGMSRPTVQRYLARFEEDETALAGSLFENFVAMELVKQATWAKAGARIHHLRTAGGREVDILIERADGSVCGVEVKLGAVIHTGAETLPFGQGLWALPVSALWTGASAGRWHHAAAAVARPA